VNGYKNAAHAVAVLAESKRTTHGSRLRCRRVQNGPLIKRQHFLLRIGDGLRKKKNEQKRIGKKRRFKYIQAVKRVDGKTFVGNCGAIQKL
jgi:hypothetical protein